MRNINGESKGKTLPDREKKAETWWYMHIGMFLSGIVTFGILDGLTAMWMMKKYGASVEYNPMLRELFIMQGEAAFLAFKIINAVLILSIPLLLYKKKALRWATFNLLIVFTIGGMLAAIANYIFLISGKIWIEPEIITGSMLFMAVIGVEIGEMLDQRRNSYLWREQKFRISKEEWERMKIEMGISGERGDGY
ncbi:MAG: hypothetical protein ACXQTS_05025 [Candidatus Methanospirareceae archaeon]